MMFLLRQKLPTFNSKSYTSTNINEVKSKWKENWKFRNLLHLLLINSTFKNRHGMNSTVTPTHILQIFYNTSIIMKTNKINMNISNPNRTKLKGSKQICNRNKIKQQQNNIHEMEINSLITTKLNRLLNQRLMASNIAALLKRKNSGDASHWAIAVFVLFRHKREPRSRLLTLFGVLSQKKENILSCAILLLRNHCRC